MLAVGDRFRSRVPLQVICWWWYDPAAILDGRWMGRVAIGGAQTERAHVEALWARLRAEAEPGH